MSSATLSSPVVKPLKRSKKTAIKDDDDDDLPLSKLKEAKRPKVENNGKKTKQVKSEPVKGSNGQKAKKSSSSAKDGVKKEEEEGGVKEQSAEAEENDDVYRWWEEMEAGDNSQKWETMEHNGVLFPPPYEPLPNNVKMLYDGKPVKLSLDAEEVAGFFGAMLNSDHVQNPVFQKNFFNDFVDVIKDTGGATYVDGTPAEIKEFSKCDFSKIFTHYDNLREAKKALPSHEKKRLKAEKDKAEEKYKYCILDGRKEPVGNFRVEPPGLFRGRGAHPKTGKLKRRVLPEQVTINIGKDATVPEPPEGHQWGEVRHDNTVAWLALWKENINGNHKYVLFGQNSALKGMSDFKKFEKARELKKHVERIRKDYTRELKDQLMVNRQRATAMYLIDVLALRAGGEKGEDEADTVGCCSLRYEHITLKPPNVVVFDFLGKDSIRYHQEVTVSKEVFKNLMIFKRPPKGVGDDIFDRLDPPLLNKHLQNYMPGLTAKVFRTYNATHTMQQQLDKIPNEGTVNEKIVAYNAANRAVAILCNHQRTVAKTHEATVGKIEDKIQELKWNKIRCKKMMLAMDPSQKKKAKGFFEDIDSLDKSTIADIHSKILEREREKVIKKFQRDNEKLRAENQKPLPETELKDRLKAVDELEETLAKELKTGKPEVKSGATVEKLKAQVEKYEERITNTQLQLKDKEDNSQVALGTSKMNYIDPRLTAMFAKKYNVPIEKLFTKTLREKFLWAIHSADENWRF